MIGRLLCTLFLVLVVGVAGTGCASVINGTSQEVAFRSVPPGATVKVSGQTGTTPATLSLSRDRDHMATLTKEGHPERQVNIRQKLSGAFYGNIALGGIIGMSVDMGNGAAYNLTPSNIEVDMATGLVREFDKDEPPRSAEAPPPSPLGTQVAPAVTTLVSASAPPAAARAAPTAPTTDTGLRYIAPNKGGGGFVLWRDL